MQNFTRRVVPLEVRTRLDAMNLLDRFLFNETVEDIQIYNDMVNILLEKHIDLLAWNQTDSRKGMSGKTIRKDGGEAYAGMGRKNL